jgi:hypothetical protein
LPLDYEYIPKLEYKNEKTTAIVEGTCAEPICIKKSKILLTGVSLLEKKKASTGR